MAVLETNELLKTKLTKNQHRLTKEEIEQLKPPARPFAERVVSRIRERYSLDDELALLRQRVLKADEFEEYYDFVEAIKLEERAREV